MWLCLKVVQTIATEGTSEEAHFSWKMSKRELLREWGEGPHFLAPRDALGVCLGEKMILHLSGPPAVQSS